MAGRLQTESFCQQVV